MKTTGTSKTVSCSHEMLLPPQPKKIHTDTSKEFRKACQDLQWIHDTNTPHHPETNGVAERAVRRVKESTAIALTRSGQPDDW